MKPINFINPIPPAAHRSIAHFMRSTLIISICFLTILGTISVYQLQNLKTLEYDVVTLTQHCARFNKLLEQQEQLAAQEQELRNKITQVTMVHKKQLNPHTLVRALHSSIPAATMLQTVSVHANELTCTVQCKNPRTAHTYLQALTKTGLFATVRLTEIRSQTHAYQVTLQLTRI
jgi:Tfp pilus assembly protein PilN